MLCVLREPGTEVCCRYCSNVNVEAASMSNGLLEVIAVISAFCVSWWLTSAVRRHAGALHLVQSPNERSSHVIPTPSGGGVGIAVAGSVAGLFFCSGAYLWLALAASVVIACVGFIDDRFQLPSRIRIVIHFAIVGSLLLVVPTLPAIVTPLGPVPGVALYALALIVGVWWINLFNFMDGIDGLAASEAVFLCIGLAVLILVAGVEGMGSAPTMPWLIALAAASAGFLVLNWPPAKVFMGDVGSNYLAVILLALTLFEIAVGRVSYSAALILVATFVTDATITLLRRAFAGERWFAAHRLHAYQKLSRRWHEHRRVTLLYLAINLIWLYPLAYLATAFPQYGWLAVSTAYVPLAFLCIGAGAGVPETATGNI